MCGLCIQDMTRALHVRNDVVVVTFGITPMRSRTVRCNRHLATHLFVGDIMQSPTLVFPRIVFKLVGPWRIRDCRNYCPGNRNPNRQAVHVMVGHRAGTPCSRSEYRSAIKGICRSPDCHRGLVSFTFSSEFRGAPWPSPLYSIDVRGQWLGRLAALCR